jgi:hypothetical protein
MWCARDAALERLDECIDRWIQVKDREEREEWHEESERPHSTAGKIQRTNPASVRMRCFASLDAWLEAG